MEYNNEKKGLKDNFPSGKVSWKDVSESIADQEQEKLKNSHPENFNDEEYEDPEVLPATLIGGRETRRSKKKEKKRRKSKSLKNKPLSVSETNHLEKDTGPSYFDTNSWEGADDEDITQQDDSLISPNFIAPPSSPGAYAITPTFNRETDNSALPSNWDLNTDSGGSPLTSQHDAELIEANLVEEQNIPSAEAVPVKFMRRKSYMYVCIFLIGIVSFVLSVVMTRSNDEPNSTSLPSFLPSVAPSFSPTSSVRQIIENVSPESIPAFEDQLSPQYQALDWTTGDYQNIESTDQVIQRYALATIFFSTGGGEQWSNSRGWLSEQPECNWFSSNDNQESICRLAPGVLSSRSFYSFVSLELKDMNLSGDVPPEIRLLSNLESINLSRNPLDGTIPSQIGLLTKLSRFDLTRAGVAGSIPTEIGLLSLNLNAIHVSGNRLDGSIPSEIGLLKNLRLLDLSGNSLSGGIPSGMALLSQLTTAHFDDNKLQGQIPSELGLMKAIEVLNLGRNYLSGGLPIGNFTSNTVFLSLRTLDLEDNSLKGSISTEIGLLPNIQTLLLRNNGIAGPLPSELGILSTLEAIDLSENELTGWIPSEIGLMTSLTKLKIGSTQVSGLIPSEIGRIWSLEELSLWQNKLTGNIVSELGLLVNLERLSIYNEEGIKGSIPSEIGLMRNLDQLSLGFNSISGTLPTEVGMLIYLEAFRVSNNKLSGTIPTEIGLFVGLKDLQFGFNRPGLSGFLPTEIGLLQILEEANIEQNSLKGQLPTEIGLMRNLKEVALNSNGLKGSLPTEIGLLRRAQGLNISHNNIMGSVPTEIGMMDNVQVLDFESNSLTGTIPTEFGLLERLEILAFEGNNLNGSVPDSVCQLKSGGLGTSGLSFDCLEVKCDCCGDFCISEPIQCQSDDDYYVQVAVSTEEFPEDILWRLTNETGKILLNGGPYNQSDIFKTIVAGACISLELCASFIIEGNGENEIDSLQRYNLYVEGNLIHEGIASKETPPIKLCPPTMAPTVALIECNANSAPFRLHLTVFDRASETAWQLVDSDGNMVVEVDFGLATTGVFQECLEVNSCFTFNIFDLNGDGICCSSEKGRYSLYWDGQQVAEGGQFGFKDTFTIGTCTTPDKSPTPPIECIGEMKSIRVEIFTDFEPEETSWELVDVTLETTVMQSRSYSSFEKLRNFTEETCFDNNTCLVFTINDSHGNGMLEPGFFAIYVDDEQIYRGGQFGNSDIVQVGNGCIDTAAPTSTPTGAPVTESPTTEIIEVPPPSTVPSAVSVPSIQCKRDEGLFHLELTTDDRPGDTTWVLQNAKTGESLLELEESYADTSTTFVHELCVGNDLCLAIILYDSSGDGIKEPGGYAIYFDGVDISRGNQFGSLTSFQFGNCPKEKDVGL